MLLHLFDYHLPVKFIADKPAKRRDYARMLVYRSKDNKLKDVHFYDLPKLLGKNDVLVFNNSRVIPARILNDQAGTWKEIFFLEYNNGFWKCLVRPGKFFPLGAQIKIAAAVFIVKKTDPQGFRYLQTALSQQAVMNLLQKKGSMPVPPYIKGRHYHEEDYNTVFSKISGSVAAPTAGLHFTTELLKKLQSKGIAVEFVTLHVGLGTFLPVKTNDLRNHKMHSEKYEIDFQTARRINQYKQQGKRIIAVGTTAIRVLEDNYARNDCIKAGKYDTAIFIKPGYKWRIVAGMITNFHLPKSTLIMLVSAFIGKNNTMALYEYAKRRAYRFYSFGDGMLLF